MTCLTKLLFCDVETYSETDLQTCGVYKYVEDSTFEVMLFGYAYNDEPRTVVDLAQGEELPAEVLEDLTRPEVLKIAHNANFERTCLTKSLGVYMAPEQWFCTAVLAAMLGLPRSLAAVGEVLGLKEDEKKMTVGKRLIMYFAKPCLPTKSNGGRTRNLPRHEPEKWELYKTYNGQDVDVERTIYKKLKSYPKMTKSERSLWCLDQRMNEGGVLIDTTLVENILSYSERHQIELQKRATEISGIDNSNSLVQIKRWLRSKGVNPESLDKNAVVELMKEVQETAPDVAEFLRIRQELGKTSVTKYSAISRALCGDNRIRGMLQFYGANRTGRWAGRLVQLQNLPQNKLKDLALARKLVRENDFELLELLFDSPMDVFSQLIRTSFIAREGSTFVVADYSAIEARVIAWLAGEKWRLDVFKTHGKIYEASASQMFHVPIESITKDSPLRKKGKVAELALGYQGAVGALEKMGGSAMGLTQEEMEHLVTVWRETNSKIVELWRTVETAAKKAIAHPGTAVEIQHGIVFKMYGLTLFVTLPSGRSLAYQNARIEKIGMRSSIKYMGQNQQTQRWEEVDTYGGKLTENLTQAVARDCLGAAMLRLDEAGYRPQFHVHDEVIVEANAESAETDMERIRELMTLKGLEWVEALPLTADAYMTSFYMKD